MATPSKLQLADFSELMTLTENIFEETESVIELAKPDPTMSQLLRDQNPDCMGAESSVINFGVIMLMTEAASHGELGSTLKGFLSSIACHPTWAQVSQMILWTFEGAGETLVGKWLVKTKASNY